MNRITFKRTSLLFGLLLSMAPMLAQAQVQQDSLLQKGTLNLEDAIKVAVANNPEVNRALLSVQDADQMVRIAYSEVFPNISSSMSYTRNIETPVNYLPAQIFDPDAPEGELIGVSFGTDNNWQGGFSVTQNIFQGEVFVGLSTSTIFKTVQQENLRATTQQIITQTRQAYYQVLVAKEQLRLQEAQIRRLEANLRENKSRNRAGLVDDYAVLQIEVQLSNQRPSLVEARYAVKEAYRSLKQVLGIPLEFDFEVKGDLNAFDIVAKEAEESENSHLKRVDQMNPFTYEKTNEQWASMLDDRGDIRMLNANLDLRDKEILAIKSRFLPTLSATYNLQWSAAQPGSPTFFQNPEPNTDPNRFQTLAINFSLPIFEGFKRFADVQQAQIQRKDVEEQKRAARLNAQNEIASAAEALNKAFETAEARRQALEQAQEGYERALKRLENGIGSQIEVTEAEVQVRQAEVNYALMVFEYLNAKAQYDLATGQVPFVDTATYN
ncbi:TolC family protein [Gracilimonas mengyeensis]|uniref:Outer membrane protein TolC n=1 Tax=Gracilimonas mengyeensis TaxID=1302730 RepID=A0A521BWW3_9BACT|nr:TolC family protein [Gracilimonas mengyeensis]SMO51669.1 Outer membrane protein TolC [Gracilimonas mengyeensis]